MRFPLYALRVACAGLAGAAAILLTAAPAAAQAPAGQEPYGWPWLVRALDRLKPDTDTRIPETPTQVVNRLEAMIDQGQGAAALTEIRALQEKRAASSISGIDARLRRALDDYRLHGWCASEGEWDPAISGVAAPLVLGGGTEVLAINCGGSSRSLTRRSIERSFGPRVRELARTVVESLEQPAAREASPRTASTVA